MNKNIIFYFIVLLFISVLLSQTRLNAFPYQFLTDTTITAKTSKSTSDSMDYKEKKIDSLIVFAKNYLGLPYKYKGCDKNGFDCSGFIHYIFKNFGYELPRSSVGLSNIGKEIELHEVKKGDLLFFKGRNMSSKKIGHVSLVIAVDEKSVSMIHSTNRGIIIDRLCEIKYYKTRFVCARHLDL